MIVYIIISLNKQLDCLNCFLIEFISIICSSKQKKKHSLQSNEVLLTFCFLFLERKHEILRGYYAHFTYLSACNVNDNNYIREHIRYQQYPQFCVTNSLFS